MSFQLFPYPPIDYRPRLGPFLLGPNTEPENGVYCGDARVLAEHIPNKSIDLIFTDPPYPKEFLQCFSDLAVIAKRVLKPGAMLICYSGQQNFPEAFNRLNAVLDYHWLGWINHSGPNQRIWHKRLFCGGKPLMMFSKGKPNYTVWLDDTTSSGMSKKYHNWGQSLGEAIDYIEKLTKEGDVILEPFSGGGTVPAACKQLKRKYIAFEIDPDHCRTSRKRIKNTQSMLFQAPLQQTRLEIA